MTEREAMHEETVFTLAISTARFQYLRRNEETARILRDVVRRLERGEAFGPDYVTLPDSTGAAVGRAAFRLWTGPEAAWT